MKQRHFLLLIAILGLLIYANSWGNAFVWDDEFLIVKNSYIRDWQQSFDIFTSELRQFEITTRSNFYRPLQTLSFSLDYSLWRLNPFGYHLTNTLLHISVGLLVYLLVNLIARDKIIALLTSLFFLAHPVHTEAVTYISGRAEPMTALFLLLSLFLFVKYTYFPHTLGYYLGALFSFFLALLSKEVAIIFPLALIAYLFCFRDRCASLKESPYTRHPCLWFVLLSLGYLLLRLSVINFAGRLILASKDSLYIRLLTFFKAFWGYIGLLFFPHNLHLERQLPPVANFFDPQVLLGLLMLAGGIALIIIAKRKSRPLICFGLLWFFIFLLPVSNIIPLDVSIAEHWLYLPSIGIFLVFSVAVSRLYQRQISPLVRKIFICILAAILAIYSILTIRQNRVWKDAFTLYNRILKFNPESFVVHNNLGIIYLHNGFVDEAIDEFKQALKLKPDYVNAHNNLGNAYTGKELFDLAIDEYNIALRLNPNLSTIQINLNSVYQLAISNYKEAVRLDPKDGFAYNKLGNIYERQDDFDKAMEQYKMAVKVNPDFARAYYNMGVVYANQGNLREAIKQWERALKITPDYKKAKANIEKAKQLLSLQE